MTLRALTLLNQCGDVTLVWEEQNDAAMESYIEKKMAEGVSFFIITPRFGGLAAPEKSPLKTAVDAKKYRALSVPDEHVQQLVEAGAVELTKTPDKPAKSVRRSKDPKEVAKSESVGVQPRRGG